MSVEETIPIAWIESWAKEKNKSWCIDTWLVSKMLSDWRNSKKEIRYFAFADDLAKQRDTE